MPLQARPTRSKKMKRFAIISILTLTSLETHTKVWKDSTNEKKTKIWKGRTNEKKTRVWRGSTNEKKPDVWKNPRNEKKTRRLEESEKRKKAQRLEESEKRKKAQRLEEFEKRKKAQRLEESEKRKKAQRLEESEKRKKAQHLEDSTNEKKPGVWSAGTNKQATTLEETTSNLQKVVEQTGKPPQSQCHDCRFDQSPVKPDGISLKPYTVAVRGKEALFHNRCKNFIKDNGTYGPWGKVIEQYFLKQKVENDKTKSEQENNELKAKDFFSPALKGMQSSPRICPNWGRLEPKQKLKFWVWTFAAIAQDESRCNPKALNKGTRKHPIPNPRDPPAGLFQLNSRLHKREDRGRNCKFEEVPEKLLMSKEELPKEIVTSYITCSLDIMHDLIEIPVGRYGGSGKIYPTYSYWQKLRYPYPTGGVLGANIRRYPLCNDSPKKSGHQK